MTSGLVATLRDPVYRAILLVLVAQGFIFGGQAPYVPLWATDVLRADAAGVGTLQAWAALAAVGFGLAFGLRTDRSRRRTRWLLGAFVVGLVARLLLVRAADYRLATLLFALANLVSFTLVFAVLGDWLRHRQQAGAARVHSAIRLAFALGWQIGAIGAIGAGMLVLRFGYGALFLATAVF